VMLAAPAPLVVTAAVEVAASTATKDEPTGTDGAPARPRRRRVSAVDLEN